MEEKVLRLSMDVTLYSLSYKDLTSLPLSPAWSY